jgi:hypothetical protein
MTLKKKASQLKKGDKILGQTNFWYVEDVHRSHLTGNSYPVIDVVDAFGKRKSIETGQNEKFQDHIYEVEVPPKN